MPKQGESLGSKADIHRQKRAQLATCLCSLGSVENLPQNPQMSPIPLTFLIRPTYILHPEPAHTHTHLPSSRSLPVGSRMVFSFRVRTQSPNAMPLGLCALRHPAHFKGEGGETAQVGLLNPKAGFGRPQGLGLFLRARSAEDGTKGKWSHLGKG